MSSFRPNLVQDLYIKELKAFKPKPLTEADAQEATMPWKLPQAAKAPALEAEGVDALAEYESSNVEVSTPKAKGTPEGTQENYNPDDWFVFEEDKA